MQIYVNIYDFLFLQSPFIKTWNRCVSHWSLNKYCYCVNDTDPTASGVVIIQPQSADYIFSRKVYVGLTNCSNDELQRIIYDLQLQYTCGEYNIFSNNCNHFSDELIRKVSGKELPRDIFRMTNCLKCLCFCLPKGLVSGQWELQKIRKKEAQEEQEIRRKRESHYYHQNI